MTTLNDVPFWAEAEKQHMAVGTNNSFSPRDICLYAYVSTLTICEMNFCLMFYDHNCVCVFSN